MSDTDDNTEEDVQLIARSKDRVKSRITGLNKLEETLTFLKREDDTDINVVNPEDSGIIEVYVSSETAYDEFKFLCDISRDLTSYTANRSLDYDPHSEKYSIHINFKIE